MALETATYIDSLVVTNPDGTDAKSTADDHLRLIKAAIKRTFPNVTGEVSATHTQINNAAIGAVSVTYAQSAGYAAYAEEAVYAGSANSAGYATSANHCASAVAAGQATYAASAGYAVSAATALAATNAQSAVYATDAGYAASAGYAPVAGRIHQYTNAAAGSQGISAGFAGAALQSISSAVITSTNRKGSWSGSSYSVSLTTVARIDVNWRLSATAGQTCQLYLLDNSGYVAGDQADALADDLLMAKPTCILSASMMRRFLPGEIAYVYYAAPAGAVLAWSASAVLVTIHEYD